MSDPGPTNPPVQTLDRSRLISGWPMLLAVAVWAIGLPLLSRLGGGEITGTAAATLIGFAVITASVAGVVLLRMPGDPVTAPFVGLVAAVATLLALAPLDHPAQTQRARCVPSRCPLAIRTDPSGRSFRPGSRVGPPSPAVDRMGDRLVCHPAGNVPRRRDRAVDGRGPADRRGRRHLPRDDSRTGWCVDAVVLCAPRADHGGPRPRACGGHCCGPLRR